MWELDYKEGWVPKNWCFLTVVLEKTLDSSLDWKELKPKGNQPWIFTGRTDAETPILWPPGVNSRLTGKDPDAGKDWGQEEEGGERGWGGWVVSLTQWTWVWASSGRWWRIRKPGVLQSMKSQRVEHNLAAEQHCKYLVHFLENQKRNKLLFIAKIMLHRKPR